MGRQPLMRATDLTKYIEGLTLTHGAKAGQPFRLLQWQRQFVKGMAKRGVYRAALSVPRGPGKTTLLAAVASAAIDGPLRVPRGEVVVVASSFDPIAPITRPNVLDGVLGRLKQD